MNVQKGSKCNELRCGSHLVPFVLFFSSGEAKGKQNSIASQLIQQKGGIRSNQAANRQNASTPSIRRTAILLQTKVMYKNEIACREYPLFFYHNSAAKSNQEKQEKEKNQKN